MSDDGILTKIKLSFDFFEYFLIKQKSISIKLRQAQLDTGLSSILISEMFDAN